jgi:hypothetical protein
MSYRHSMSRIAAIVGFAAMDAVFFSPRKTASCGSNYPHPLRNML